MRAPAASEHLGAHHHAAVGEFGEGDVFARDAVGDARGGFGDGGGEGARALLHLGLELLAHDLVAQPHRDFLPRDGVREMVERRRRHLRAEVHGDAREPLRPAFVPHPAHADGVAQVARDDLRAGVVDEERRAVVDPHQRAGGGNAALGKNHELAAGREVVGHRAHGVGGRVVHRERAGVDHHLPVNPRRLRRRGRRDKFPIVVEADEDEKPVEPRGVVGAKHHRSRAIERFRTKDAVAEEELREQAQQKDHADGWGDQWVTEHSTRRIAAPQS